MAWHSFSKLTSSTRHTAISIYAEHLKRNIWSYGRPCEGPIPESLGGINPHHLTNALRRLAGEGRIREEIDETRGGRRVPVIVPTDQRKHMTKVAKAAARKRILQARYLGGAEQSSRGVNVIGDAGEIVTHRSLSAAGPIGIKVFNERGGRIENLLGQHVAGGPLDAAAQLIVEVDAVLGVVTIPIEVKNLRPWLYPRAAENYQLLDKSARLQIAFPNHLIMPVMVLRRAHFLSFAMAKHLGLFFVQFPFSAQPILPHNTVNREHLAEVEAELGYTFLVSDEVLPGLTKGFVDDLPPQALTFSRRWHILPGRASIPDDEIPW